MGIGVAAIVRVFLFLAVLGVVAGGASLDSGNPAADAFRQGAGEIGYRFAGLVLLCAAITSIIGAAYTSVSFLKTFHTSIAKNENYWVIGFIAFSTLVMLATGSPAALRPCPFLVSILQFCAVAGYQAHLEIPQPAVATARCSASIRCKTAVFYFSRTSRSSMPK